MDPAATPRSRGLSLRDMLGLVAGFALAGFLLRHWRPGDSSDMPSVIVFGGAYLWFGLALSGPIVLWIGRVGEPGRVPPRTPRRLGRLIAEVPAGTLPEGRKPDDVARDQAPFTFNEMLWIGIGGFWATLTLSVTSSIGGDLSGAVMASIPGFCWLILGPWIVRSMARGSPTGSWTHLAASAVILAWPFAAVMLLLSTGLFWK